MGRGTYAAVIILPENTGEEVKAALPLVQNNTAVRKHDSPPKNLPCRALTADMAAGIDGHLT